MEDYTTAIEAYGSAAKEGMQQPWLLWGRFC